MTHHRIHLFDDFTLDLSRGFLLHDDELVHLRPQTYEVLRYLVEHRGELISKDKIIEDVWRGRAVTDGSLGKCIEELRVALGHDATQYVRNVRGRGYIFDPQANGQGKIESTSEQIDVFRMVVLEEGKESRPTFANGRIRTAKLGLAVGLFVLLLAAGGLGYWLFAGRSSKPLPIESIAVMPFVNEGGDPDAEYLSDGISESVINDLSQLSHLKVVARSSSFMYKGKMIPQQVANALGVHGIITGRIVRLGENLQISVELMDARDQRQVWGAQYNRRGSDLLAIQSEISREIANKLRLHLTAGEQQQLAKRANANPEAYELLLKARFFARKGGPENRKKANEYYEQAIGVDPTYAPAYAELSTSYSLLIGSGNLDPKEFRPKAEWAARKALEFDDNLADAHYALAILKQSAWEWATAESEFQRAIELNPNLAQTHLLYSNFLMNTGRYNEAMVEARRSRELDPLSLRAHLQIGTTLAAGGHYDEAIESLKKTLEMDEGFGPAHFNLGYIYTARGMYAEGVVEYQRSISLGGDTPTGQIYLGAAYAKAGPREKALEILKRLETSKEYISPAELAVLYVALGDREQAFASLERGYAAHDLQLQHLRVDVSYDGIREDSRFKDLVRRVGLP